MSTPNAAGGIPAQTAPTNTTAIISLVAGILGLSLIPFIGSIVAVITGNMAKREIQASRGAYGGDGLATVGLVLGWVGIGLPVLGACFGGAFFFLVPACLALLGIASSSSTSLAPVMFVML